MKILTAKSSTREAPTFQNRDNVPPHSLGSMGSSLFPLSDGRGPFYEQGLGEEKHISTGREKRREEASVIRV